MCASQLSRDGCTHSACSIVFFHGAMYAKPHHTASAMHSCNEVAPRNLKHRLVRNLRKNQYREHSSHACMIEERKVACSWGRPRPAVEVKPDVCLHKTVSDIDTQLHDRSQSGIAQLRQAALPCS
jgi:hypothetical protein